MAHQARFGCALEEAGVDATDIDVTYSDPLSARRLFEAGAVDAWAIWDPHLAAVQHASGARILCDATGLTANRAFYVGTPAIERRPDLVDLFLGEVARLGRTANDNAEAVVDLLGASLGVARPALLVALRRNRFGLQPFDADLAQSQQGIADLSGRANLIPRAISVADARWIRAAPPCPVPHARPAVPLTAPQPGLGGLG